MIENIPPFRPNDRFKGEGSRVEKTPEVDVGKDAPGKDPEQQERRDTDAPPRERDSEDGKGGQIDIYA